MIHTYKNDSQDSTTIIQYARAKMIVQIHLPGVAGTTASVAVFETGLFPLLRTSFKSSVRRAFVAFDSAFVALDSSWDALKAASNVAMRAAVGSVS